MAPDQLTTSDRPLLGIPVAVRRIGLCVATGVVSLVLVTACSSSSGSDKSATGGTGNGTSTSSTPMDSSSMSSSMAMSSGSSMTASAGMIMIQNFKYTTPVTVSPGAMVSVMNMDGEAHTVTADSGNAFDDMATADKTTTFKAPMTPGSYPYHCTYHSNMHGVLIVK